MCLGDQLRICAFSPRCFGPCITTLSVTSGARDVHVEMCICQRCVMCDNSRQQLADNKDVLVGGITTRLAMHVSR